MSTQGGDESGNRETHTGVTPLLDSYREGEEYGGTEYGEGNSMQRVKAGGLRV